MLKGALLKSVSFRHWFCSRVSTDAEFLYSAQPFPVVLQQGLHRQQSLTVIKAGIEDAGFNSKIELPPDISTRLLSPAYEVLSTVEL